MIVMDYKDAGAYMMLFFALAVIAILVPVFWVGDIAIAIIDYLFSNPPRILYIVAWILACGGYYFYILESYVANIFLKGYDRSLHIIVFYAQGLFFAYLVSLTQIGKFSLLPLLLPQ